MQTESDDVSIFLKQQVHIRPFKPEWICNLTVVLLLIIEEPPKNACKWTKSQSQ